MSETLSEDFTLAKPGLSYLSDPQVENFSKLFFGSLLRLPLGGAIYELTPRTDLDVVQFAQVNAVLPNLDKGNLYREFKRYEQLGMIALAPSESEGRNVSYTRSATHLWDVIYVSLCAARLELTDNTEA